MGFFELAIVKIEIDEMGLDFRLGIGRIGGMTIYVFNSKSLRRKTPVSKKRVQTKSKARTKVKEDLNFYEWCEKLKKEQKDRIAEIRAKQEVEQKKRDAVLENSPLVGFYYPMSFAPWNGGYRTVRVISVNSKYLIGIELNGPRPQFKKYLKSKMSDFQMVEYHPEKMCR